MTAVQILTAMLVCLVTCSQRTIFWLGVDLIAVISIFWHFWIAHNVEPAELLELIFCQGDQLQTLSYLTPQSWQISLASMKLLNSDVDILPPFHPM